ncbi:MAG: SH3 domain-containing protein [Gammaproteobacteria bacterium]
MSSNEKIYYPNYIIAPCYRFARAGNCLCNRFLQLRVYSSPSSDCEFLKTIDSGDSFEVFASQDGFSQVTTHGDTKGWVKIVFLVEEAPAKLLYYFVSEKNKKLEVELKTLKSGGY